MLGKHTAEEVRKRALVQIPNMKLLYAGRGTSSYLQHFGPKLDEGSFKTSVQRRAAGESTKIHRHPRRGPGDEESQWPKTTFGIEPTRCTRRGRSFNDLPRAAPDDGSDMDLEDDGSNGTQGGEEDDDDVAGIDCDLVALRAATPAAPELPGGHGGRMARSQVEVASIVQKGCGQVVCVYLCRIGSGATLTATHCTANTGTTVFLRTFSEVIVGTKR